MSDRPVNTAHAIAIPAPRPTIWMIVLCAIAATLGLSGCSPQSGAPVTQPARTSTPAPASGPSATNPSVALAPSGAGTKNLSASTTTTTPGATAAPADLSKGPNGMELATFGAGCFWGVEHVLRQQPGVIDAVSGYSGGASANPTYEQVCSGRSGHVEVVQVTFDPKKLSYDQVLSVFFRLHNPTQVNGQGPDIGDQYRSVIFYQSEAQKTGAEKLIADLTAAKKFKRPIATTVEPFAKFWPAEEYHQKYYQRKGTEPYCHVLRADY